MVVLVLSTEKAVDYEVEDVLVFFTGSSSIPPLGFDTQPSLSFNHSGPLATASTCDLRLNILAIHTSFEKFKEAMLLSIKDMMDLAVHNHSNYGH